MYHRCTHDALRWRTKVKDRETIALELQTIAEDLNDLSMRLLSEAIDAGQTTRPPEEKSVSQARRAVEKAIHHLTSL